MSGSSDSEAVRLREWVHQAQAGKAEPRDRLLQRLYPIVRRWALVRTGSQDEADDVCQEVMIRVNRFLHQFDGRSSVTTWAYRITANAVADARRRRPETTGHGVVAEPWAEPKTLAAVQHQTAADLIRTFFDELSDRQREVLDLVDLQGYAPSEVAEMLQMNPNTVRAHLHRARHAIRSRMLQRYPAVSEEYVNGV